MGFKPRLTANWHIVGTAIGPTTYTVEVWTKSGFSGDWLLKTTVPIEDLTATVDVEHFLTNYQVAIRVLSNGFPIHTGTPDTWPEQNRFTGVTLGTVQSLTIDNWFDDGVNTGFEVTYVGPGAGPDAHPELTYEVERSINGGGVWAAVENSPFTALPEEIHLLHADDGENIRFRIRVVGPNGPSAWYTDNVDYAFGPTVENIQVTNINSPCDGGGQFDVSWEGNTPPGARFKLIWEIDSGNAPYGTSGPTTIVDPTNPQTVNTALCNSTPPGWGGTVIVEMWNAGLTVLLATNDVPMGEPSP